MARMIPTTVTNFNGSRGEAQVYAALQRLPNSVVGLHSIQRLGDRRWGARSGEGEADFIVVDPDRGILVIEVKGGDIKCGDGRWLQRQGDGDEFEPIDPVRQARDNMHWFRDHLRSRVPGSSKTLFGYVVWFPKVRLGEMSLPPGCPSEITFCGDDLNNAEARLAAAFDYWRSQVRWDTVGTGAATQAVIDVLAPTFTLPSASFADVPEPVQVPVVAPLVSKPLLASRLLGEAGWALLSALRFVLELPLKFAQLVVKVAGAGAFWFAGFAWRAVKWAAELICGVGILVALGAAAFYFVGQKPAALEWLIKSGVAGFCAFAIVTIGQSVEGRLKRSVLLRRLRSLLTFA